MAGDRGLAFVVVGLISLSTLWVANSRKLPIRWELTASADQSQDTEFLESVIEQQSSAVLLGQLAMERAATTAIRQFAQTIIADSARLNAELKRIALFRGVTFPGELNAEDRASYEYLLSLSGAEFDQGYVHHALRRGNAALAQFQDEAAHGAHPEIQRFAGILRRVF